MKGKTKVLYILIAFVTSVLLWVYVVGVERPQKEDTITGVPVTFNGEEELFEDYNLVVTSDKRPTVDLTVMGSIKDIAAMNTNKESISVVANLYNLKSPGLKQISYTVNLPNENVTLLEQSPYYLGVRLEKVTVAPVEVVLENNGSVEEGYIAKTPQIEPASLQISGPEQTVSSVDHAVVVWSRENMDKTLSLDLGYTLYDSEGNIIPTDDLSVNYDVVNVTMPIQKFKTIPLTVGFIDGGGATGQNASASIDPPTIEIAGEPSVIDGLNSIQVADIDLAELVGAWSGSYDILLPNGVESLSGETECSVSVKMSGLKITTISCDNITLIHEPEGYEVELVARERQVTLRGPVDEMDRMDPDDIRIVVDLADQNITEKGRRTVPAKVYVDIAGGTGIKELYPVTIAIDVQPEK